MTAISRLRKRPTRSNVTPGTLCFGMFSLFCLLLILRNATVAITYMTAGLQLCARTVIPSLFPFMVLSEWIVSGEMAEPLLSKITRPLQKLLGLPSAGCSAVLLGLLCGFPVGARCAVIAYTQGKLTRKEAQRVLLVGNCPSSAFLINAVGVSLWENHTFGLVLYATVVGTALLLGSISHFFNRTGSQAEKDRFPEITVPVTAPPLRGARLFTESVRAAAGNILLVCAYVVFFSTLVGTLSTVLTPLHLPSVLQSAIFCLFELSGGISRAATLAEPYFAAILTAFAAGWAGLSVHCQILSVCDGKELSLRGYMASKLLQGLLCALIFGILIQAFPQLLIPATAC